jgi:hypothetical protein
MVKKIVIRAALLMALAPWLSADTIQFGLAGDPGQNYTFTPIGAAAGVTDTEPVGPYPGWLGQDITADDSFFFCITFLKTANWGASYSGTTIAPSTAQQLEAAYLGAELVSLGDQNATLAEKGAISLAIWQITDPTPGDVPRDPAAQSYVTAAGDAYSSGAITAADFPNTLIFVPSDPAIQSFMIASPGSATFTTLFEESSGVPEPGTVFLILTGGGLIGLSRARRKRRK